MRYLWKKTKNQVEQEDNWSTMKQLKKDINYFRQQICSPYFTEISATNGCMGPICFSALYFSISEIVLIQSGNLIPLKMEVVDLVIHSCGPKG